MGRRQPASMGAEERSGSLWLVGCRHLAACPGAGTPFPFTGDCKKCQFALQMTLKILHKMELPYSDLLHLQSIQSRRGLVKLVRGSWDDLASHRPILGSQGKGSPVPSACYKKYQQAVLLILHFSTKRSNSSRQR